MLADTLLCLFADTVGNVAQHLRDALAKEVWVDPVTGRDNRM